jgi:hypothetical protein
MQAKKPVYNNFKKPEKYQEPKNKRMGFLRIIV